MEIEELPVNEESLAVYSTIPSRFEVRSRLVPQVVDRGLGGMVLREEMVDPPYVKDYDALDEEGLTRWLRNFDTANWRLFLAREGATPVGGATVAFRTAGLHILGGREDIAVLWDIRVCPEHWRRGVGTALLAGTARWAGERDCTHLKIETQNTNVAACHFYAARGCRLGEVNRFAYSDPRVSHETMLVWYLELR